MIDYGKMRKKFPAKRPPRKGGKSAVVKAIAKEYELRKAELGASAPLIRRGFPYYMTIITGLLVVGGLVGTAVTKRGGIDLARKNNEKAVLSVHNLAVALGRYCYHVGRFPSTDEGLEQLSAKRVGVRGWNGPYVKKVNQDPWKRDYVYVCNAPGEPPTLYSKGPDGKAGTTDDVIADPADFDAAFRDTSWTKDWVPQHLRDIVVAQDEAHKKALQEEVEKILHPDVPVEGVTPLSAGWEFAFASGSPVYGSDSAPDGDNPSPADPGLAWRKVRVPHDWAAAGAFSANPADAPTGSLPWRGAAWYRRRISIPEKARGRRIALSFADVSGHVDAFVGGKDAGGSRAAGGPLELDISDAVTYGGFDELIVAVDTREIAADGYPGAGLVGEASLVIEDAADRVLEGTYRVETLDVSEASAKMRIVYEAPSGAVTNDFDIAEPNLWTPSRPLLYKGYLEGRMRQYAVRKYGVAADGAFTLDGEPLALRGARIGADMGLLGMAFNREAARRRLQSLKDAGLNAVAFEGGSAPCAAYLDLCDEMGFVVWDAAALGPAPTAAFAHRGFDRLGGAADGSPIASDGLCDVAYAPKRLHKICRAAWSDDAPAVEFLTHWTHRSADGSEVAVECATPGDEAELFVNGESAGRRKVPDGAAAPEDRVLKWSVAYEPGEIKAIAYRRGAYIGEASCRTAFAPFSVRLKSDRGAVADGELAFVEVDVIDKYDAPVPDADGAVSFALEGPGEIVAAANPSPRPAASFGETASHQLFDGRATVVVRRNVGGSGLPLKLKASLPGLRAETITIPRR